MISVCVWKLTVWHDLFHLNQPAAVSAVIHVTEYINDYLLAINTAVCTMPVGLKGVSPHLEVLTNC